jgi:hypothetical protein
MPMLAFLPWSTVDEPMQFGPFRLLPLAHALNAGLVPQALHAAVATILEGYGKKREVDRARVAVLHHEDIDVTADLTDEQIADYYSFQTRLAFSGLSARDFFRTRYCNSDALALTIRGFTIDSGGAVLVERRRRDGATRILYSEGNFLEKRPDHIGWCDLSLDLDRTVLTALEHVAAKDDPAWANLAEALRVFVRANTDSPAVDVQSELVDLVSGFSRIADEWQEPATTRAFLTLLPPPVQTTATGPKCQISGLAQSLASGRTLRGAWLKDAFLLRHQYGHGRVIRPSFNSVWTAPEHLLLGAWIFPIVVKAVLRQLGAYQFSREDHFRDRAFERLLQIEPFARVARPSLDGEQDEDTWTNWEAAMDDLRMRFAGEEILRIEEEREATARSPRQNAQEEALDQATE